MERHVADLMHAQNWQKEIHKWLGRDRLGVVVATNGKNDIQNFGRNKNSSVLIIGYEKVSDRGVHRKWGMITGSEVLC